MLCLHLQAKEKQQRVEKLEQELARLQSQLQAVCGRLHSGTPIAVSMYAGVCKPTSNTRFGFGLFSSNVAIPLHLYGSTALSTVKVYACALSVDRLRRQQR